MAIKLQDKANVIAPGGAYPYGNIKDNDGSNNGTPVNAAVYADFHQFFARMLALSGITANGLPDNNTNGFQYYLSLLSIINIADKTLATTTTANNLISPNIYFTQNGDSSWPGGGFHVVLVIGNGSYISQWAYSISDARLFTRNSQNAGVSWTAWMSSVNRSGDAITGTLEVDGGIRTASSGAFLKTSVVDIGDWNMDSNSSRTVSISIDFKKIRSVSGVIRNDADDTYYPFSGITDTVLTGETPTVAMQYMETGAIYLLRVNSSLFDSINFDSTSYNRGWLTIVHEA
jgi:hypothetical protein